MNNTHSVGCVELCRHVLPLGRGSPDKRNETDTSEPALTDMMVSGLDINIGGLPPLMPAVLITSTLVVTLATPYLLYALQLYLPASL